MSFQQFFVLGENVTILNRACTEHLQKTHFHNQKLIDAKHHLFEIRWEIEDHCEDYDKLYFNFCKAHDLYIDVIGNPVL